MNTMTISRHRTCVDACKELIPGMPDEITLFHIIPKLSLKTIYLLASVSRAWLRSIQSRQVYNARVLSHSTKALEIFRQNPSKGQVSISSADRYATDEDYSFHMKLPQVLWHGEEVCLDGRVYILGAEKLEDGEDDDADIPYSPSIDEPIRGYDHSYKKVFMFDVAGLGQWRACASMNQRRRSFVCRAMHGKIYVFGGLRKAGYARRRNPKNYSGAEVYDPETDTWTVIRPMKTFSREHQLFVVGDEFFLFGHDFWGNDPFFDVYHTVRDEWRVVNHPFGTKHEPCMFVVGGKLHSMNMSSIHLYNALDDSWTLLHSFFIPPPFGHRRHSQYSRVSAVEAVNDELAISVSQTNYYKSTGFSSKKKKITWEVTYDDFDLSDPYRLLVNTSIHL